MSQSLKYYVYLDESVQGPHDLDYIKAMNLNGSTKICPEGSTDWTSLDSISLTPKGNDFSRDFSNYSQDYMPTKIGKYNIVNEIGRGGMGSVYLAIDELLNRKVAVKELKIDEHKKRDADSYNTMIRRFKKEAQILAQLNHKNIVSVYDIIEQNNSQYIIMEFLDGKNLEEMLNNQGTFPLEQAVSVISDTCLALDYIHKKGIVHRDVKPSNIVILTDGVTKLTDFGVTRDMNSSTMTMDGSLVGTIAYASPEQDSKELDGRSDIFSLGVVLYELVTGQKPFIGDTIASVLLKIATKDPVKPSDINPKVHKMMESIILKAMAKSLSQRYPNALEMYNDLMVYRQALQSNNQAALSGMKVNESFFSNQSKVDSIPPGKMQARDIMQSIPPGKYTFKDLAKNNTPPPTASNNTMPPIKPGMLTSNQKNPYTKSLTNTGNGLEKINLNDISNQVKKDDPRFRENVTGNLENRDYDNTGTGELSDKNSLNEDSESKNREEKNAQNKLKQQSQLSAQLRHERKEAIKRVALPSTIIFLSLIAMITGIINILDTTFLIVVTLACYRDYNNERVIKPASYLITLISMFLAYILIKMVFPSFDNAKIASYIYYLLDFSFLLFSFIGSFFIMKGLDSLSSSKNKKVRPVSTIVKSIIAFLSIIVIVSSTNIIHTPFIKTQLEKSKLANAFCTILPDLKLGKKLNITFGKYGFKVDK